MRARRLVSHFATPAVSSGSGATKPDWFAANPLLARVLLTAGVTAALMTVFEIAKQELFPSVTLWQSHVATIAITTLLAMAAALFIGARLNALNIKLRALNAELASKNAELTDSAQKLARSNAELEQFAYVASHDLQEPLRMVRSYVQLLEQRYRDRLDADAREFIDFAADGAGRMQGLISDLLSYSRLSTGGQSFQPVDCEAVFATALRNIAAAAQESGARITHAPLPNVSGDAVQLTQLFQNLLANAIKFRRDEPPEIDVRARPEGAVWRFSVQDNGIGIAPEYSEKVFVLFQRLHGRSSYAGTGIGLAICKKVVERHGGRIWVESSLGRGSTFYFTIPRSEASR